MDGFDKNFLLAGKSDADLGLPSAPADKGKSYYANAFGAITIVQQDHKRVFTTFDSKIASLFIQLVDKPANWQTVSKSSSSSSIPRCQIHMNLVEIHETD